VIVNPRFSHLSNKTEDNYQRLRHRFHNIIDKGPKQLVNLTEVWTESLSRAPFLLREHYDEVLVITPDRWAVDACTRIVLCNSTHSESSNGQMLSYHLMLCSYFDSPLPYEMTLAGCLRLDKIRSELTKRRSTWPHHKATSFNSVNVQKQHHLQAPQPWGCNTT